MTDNQKQKLEALVNRLSPENLCCDGEISKTQVNKRYRKIMQEWREIEKEVGRKISEDEVETWLIQGMWTNIGMDKKAIKSATKKYL